MARIKRILPSFFSCRFPRVLNPGPSIHCSPENVPSAAITDQMPVAAVTQTSLVPMQKEVQWFQLDTAVVLAIRHHATGR